MPGSISDLEEIMVIEQASYSFPWTEGMVLSELFDNPLSFATVVRAGEDQILAAYVFMRVVLDELHILNVAVHPQWRRRGLGKELIGCVLSTALKIRVQRVILEVRASNQPAQALYQQFGFREVGSRRNYYCRPTENALLLQYDVPSSGPVPDAAEVPLKKNA